MTYPEGVLVDVDCDNGSYKTDILVIGDPSSVVNFSTQKVEDFVGNLFILVKEHSKLFFTYH